MDEQTTNTNQCARSTKFDRLSLGSFSSTSKMLNIASDVVEDFAQEQTKFKKYLRELKDPMFYRRVRCLRLSSPLLSVVLL